MKEKSELSTFILDADLLKKQYLNGSVLCEKLKYYLILTFPLEKRRIQSKKETKSLLRFLEKKPKYKNYILTAEKGKIGNNLHFNILIEIKEIQELEKHWKRRFKNYWKDDLLLLKPIYDTKSLIKYITKENYCSIYFGGDIKNDYLEKTYKSKRTRNFENLLIRVQDNNNLKKNEFDFQLKEELKLAYLTEEELNYINGAFENYIKIKETSVKQSYKYAIIIKIYKTTVHRFKKKMELFLKNNYENFSKILRILYTEFGEKVFYYTALEELLIHFKLSDLQNADNVSFHHYFMEYPLSVLYKLTLTYYFNNLKTFDNMEKEGLELNRLSTKEFLGRIWNHILYDDYIVKTDDFLPEKVLQSFWCVIEDSIKSFVAFAPNSYTKLKVTIKDSELLRTIASIGNYYRLYPMLCLPRDWNSLESNEGGYLLNNYIQRRTGVTFSSQNRLYDSKGLIKQTLNYLQHIQYTINKEIFFEIKNLTQTFWESELENLTNSVETRDKYLEIKEKLEDLNFIENLLERSNCVNNNFYFPFHIDYRGRIYGAGDRTPTISKIFRVLLRSSKKYKITEENLKFLKYVIVRSYEKGDFSLDSTLNQFIWEDHKGFRDKWQKAAEPFEYLYYCLSFEEILIKNLKETDLMVSFDATASGLQIISLLGGVKKGSENLANDLNLKDGLITEKGKYGSIYKKYCKDFYKKEREWILEVLKIDSEIDFLKDFLSIFKSLFMKRSYGLTQWSFRDELFPKFYKKIEDKEKRKLIINVFSEKLWNFSNSTDLFEFYDLLRSYGKLLLKFNKNINWKLCIKDFLEMEITLETKQKRKHRIRMNFLDSRKKITLSTEMDKTDISKTIRSLVPNIIHWSDATLVHIGINYLRKGKSVVVVYPVHDCFITTLEDVMTVRTAMISAHYILFKELDVLPTILTQFENKLKEFPASNVELEKLLKKKHLFFNNRTKIDISFYDEIVKNGDFYKIFNLIYK